MKNTLFLLVLSAVARCSVGGTGTRVRRRRPTPERATSTSASSTARGSPHGPDAQLISTSARMASRAKCCAPSRPPSRSTSSLLIDDSQAATSAIPYIRDGLAKFIDRLQGKASIGIVTVGERPTSVGERDDRRRGAEEGRLADLRASRIRRLPPRRDRRGEPRASEARGGAAGDRRAHDGRGRVQQRAVRAGARASSTRAARRSTCWRSARRRAQ